MNSNDGTFNKYVSENDDFTEFSEYDALYNNPNESGEVYKPAAKNVRYGADGKSHIKETDKKAKTREKTRISEKR